MPQAPIARHLIGGEYYVFRDAVHNLIAIDDAEEGRALRRILRTPEMQRLRRIRQNGLASLVYPSMENSRFVHALGSYSVAQKLIQSLRTRQPSAEDGLPTSLALGDPAARAFRVAALLHDVGHAPFSHAWEEFLRDAPLEHPRGAMDPHHETRSREIVASDETEVGRILRRTVDGEPSDDSAFSGLRDDVVALLAGEHPITYLIQLLSGHLDVDRLDFMARDTRSAGVTYGFHELDWIIRSLRFARVPHDGGWVVAIDGRKGLATLVQFLLARANMYTQVYHHKTVRAAGTMLRLALRRASWLIRQGRIPADTSPSVVALLKDPLSVPLRDYIQVDDTDIWHALKMWSFTSTDSILQDLASRILRRDLFKVVELDSDTHRLLERIEAKEAGGHLARVVSARLNHAYPVVPQDHYPLG